MKYKKIVLHITQGLLLTMLMAISFISLAQPQAIKDGEFLIGFDNIEVLGVIYNVRFRNNDFPSFGAIGESSNAEKRAGIGNEVLLDLIQKHASTVGSQEYGEYCNPGKACNIFTAYDYDSDKYENFIWFLITRYEMEPNKELKSTISKKKSALREDDTLNTNQFYADWTKPGDSNWVTPDETED